MCLELHLAAVQVAKEGGLAQEHVRKNQVVGQVACQQRVQKNPVAVQEAGVACQGATEACLVAMEACLVAKEACLRAMEACLVAKVVVLVATH